MLKKILIGAANNNVISKALHPIRDMDKMIGSGFERGLAALKTVAEAAPKSPRIAAIP